MRGRVSGWLFLAVVVAAVWWPAGSASTEFASAQAANAQGRPTGLIAGRIVDQTGAPIANVVVALRRVAASGAPARGAAAAGDRVLSNETGQFVLTSLAAGRYLLDATKPGWLPGAYGRRRPGGQALSIELADNQRRNDVEIPLWRAAAIGGHVLDDNGDPLVGVEVRAIRQIFVAGRRAPDTPIRAKTDDRGEYRFAGLFPGDYLVAVLASVLSEPPGFAAIRAAPATSRTYFQTMTAVGTAPMVFDRATGVTGAGRPLVSGLSLLPGLPGSDGAWPAYPTTFHPSTTSNRSATVVRVASGETRPDVDVNVRLTPTWQVSGVLRDSEGPAAWHAVHLVPAEAADSPLVDVSTSVTDAKGAFTLFGVPPGQYILRVVRTPYPVGPGASLSIVGGTGAIPSVGHVVGGPGQGPPPIPAEGLFHASEPVTVADRSIRNLAITMREGPRVRGRARFEGSAAQPTPEQWRTVILNAVPASGRGDNTIARGEYAADGQFATASLWPGRYLIRSAAPAGWQFKDATYQGRDISETPIDIGADLDNVVITFVEKPITLSGTVQGDVGKSLEGVTVLLFPTDPARWVDYGRTSRRVASAPVSVTGEYSFFFPPAGDYFVIAIPDEVADAWQNPEMLTKLSSLAERVRVRGDVSVTQSLQLRRIR